MSKDFIFFCSHTNPATGFLSNWYLRRFVCDDNTFSSVEQFMMYNKAVLMNDFDSAGKILTESDPRIIKSFGRKVKNWNQEKWDANKLDIVTQGLMCKFSQNEDLRDKLLATGDSFLVEAADYDKIWGNGLRADHPDARYPDRWPGKNLLGECLMIVRKELQNS